MMTGSFRCSALLAIAIALGACAAQPSGPGVMVLPGSGASFEQFQRDDLGCQAHAQQIVGASAEVAAERSAVDSAVVGAVVGGAAGALIGSASGDAAEGAAIGAGSGLLVGSAAGADVYGVSGDRQQRRYDTAYIQCMYAHGHQVPLPAGAVAGNRPARYRSGDAGPATSAGFPPPGTPPPPGY